MSGVYICVSTCCGTCGLGAAACVWTGVYAGGVVCMCGVRAHLCVPAVGSKVPVARGSSRLMGGPRVGDGPPPLLAVGRVPEREAQWPGWGVEGWGPSGRR